MLGSIVGSLHVARSELGLSRDERNAAREFLARVTIDRDFNRVADFDRQPVLREVCSHPQMRGVHQRDRRRVRREQISRLQLDRFDCAIDRSFDDQLFQLLLDRFGGSGRGLDGGFRGSLLFLAEAALLQQP